MHAEIQLKDVVLLCYSFVKIQTLPSWLCQRSKMSRSGWCKGCSSLDPSQHGLSLAHWAFPQINSKPLWLQHLVPPKAHLTLPPFLSRVTNIQNFSRWTTEGRSLRLYTTSATSFRASKDPWELRKTLHASVETSWTVNRRWMMVGSPECAKAASSIGPFHMAQIGLIPWDQ